jgi:hypothetical protein
MTFVGCNFFFSIGNLWYWETFLIGVSLSSGGVSCGFLFSFVYLGKLLISVGLILIVVISHVSGGLFDIPLS